MRSWILVVTLLVPLAAQANQPVTPACKPLAASAKMTVAFDPVVSLAELTRWIASFTCKNVVFDQQVAQHAISLTVLAPKASYTPRQAFTLFKHAVEATGLVVLEKGDTVIITLGPQLARACPGAPSTAPTTGATQVTAAPPTGPLTGAELDGIKVLPDQTRTITRALIARVGRLDAGHWDVRVVPSMKENKANGFKLYAIRPGSLAARLGFQNGDTLTRVGKVTLTTADTAVTALGALDGQRDVEVEVLRRGQPLRWRIRIVD